MAFMFSHAPEALQDALLAYHRRPANDEAAELIRVVLATYCGKTDAVALARLFHEAYERLAPTFGYSTRPETREFDTESPNGQLMIEVCRELLQLVGPHAGCAECGWKPLIPGRDCSVCGSYSPPTDGA